MAGANNKSAKRLGYSAKQMETVRSKGGVLSHASLMAHGAPARPTKAYKALAEAMAARKEGLVRPSGKAPAGWQAAARGEGKAGREAATAARGALLAERAGKAKRGALAQRGAADLSRGMMASRKAEGAKRAEDASKAAAATAKRGDLAKRGALDVSGRMMANRKAAAAKANAPDPHAETRARIAQLERKVALGKQINKIIRTEEKKGGDGWEERAAQRLLRETGITNEGIARRAVQPDFAGRRGMPDYQFTNDGATIRRLKDQIGAERKKGVPMEQRKLRHVPDFGPARPGVPIRLI